VLWFSLNKDRICPEKRVKKRVSEEPSPSGTTPPVRTRYNGHFAAKFADSFEMMCNLEGMAEWPILAPSDLTLGV
jgi:hypothetical protein